MLGQSYKMCVDNKSTLKLMLYFGFVFKTQWSFLNQKIGGKPSRVFYHLRKKKKILNTSVWFLRLQMYFFTIVELILLFQNRLLLLHLKWMCKSLKYKRKYQNIVNKYFPHFFGWKLPIVPIEELWWYSRAQQHYSTLRILEIQQEN